MLQVYDFQNITQAWKHRPKGFRRNLPKSSNEITREEKPVKENNFILHQC